MPTMNSESRTALETLAKHHEALARHTTMRVGGPAHWWLEAGDEATLVAALETTAKSGYPLQVFGAGSNLVAGDAGFEGVALKLAGDFSAMRVDGTRLIAGGAAMLPKLTHFAHEKGLGGLEWACGIPGSVGGSVWGNAGARGFNGHDWESADAASVIESLVAFDRTGQRHSLTRSDIDFAYRRSSLGDLIVVEATFSLRPLTPRQQQEHREAVRALLQRRRATQPVNAASAGCIWKNPQCADCRGAGELIERLGLKGYRVGGAAISEIHGNFIVNTGSASGADVRDLMRYIEEVARREKGVQLEREVRLLGE